MKNKNLDLLKRTRKPAIITILFGYLIIFANQAEAAALNNTLRVKPTPTPTIDPILYQGSGISITVAAAILVLIVIFGVVFTLTHQK